MSQLVTPEIRAWIGKSAPPVTVRVTRRDIRKYAVATRQRLEKYLDGDEAPALFHLDLFRRIAEIDTLRPDGLAPDPLIPPLPVNRVLFGGAEITFHRPIRAGDVLVGTRTLKDIREKDGRTGPLLFVSIEVNVATNAGEPVLLETETRIGY